VRWYSSVSSMAAWILASTSWLRAAPVAAAAAVASPASSGVGGTGLKRPVAARALLSSVAASFAVMILA
jgi:hypothetical protein